MKIFWRKLWNKQLVLTDFHSIEQNTIKVNRDQTSLVTDILKNNLFCAQQKERKKLIQVWNNLRVNVVTFLLQGITVDVCSAHLLDKQSLNIKNLIGDLHSSQNGLKTVSLSPKATPLPHHYLTKITDVASTAQLIILLGLNNKCYTIYDTYKCINK